MIGTRGHDLGGIMTPRALAEAARAKGLESVQLVMHRSFEGVTGIAGYLSHSYAKRISMAFDSADVRVGLIGCYVNLLHDDLEHFKECLMYARDIGCPAVGTETGSMNSDYSYTTESHGEEAFKIAVTKVKELTAFAEKFGTTVCIEGVWCHTINTPKRMKRLLDEVASDHMRIIFDPVNYLTVDNHDSAKIMIEEAFRLFGHKIVVVHAKDYIIDDGEMKMVPIGDGLMDYDHLYELIRQYKYDLDVIIEDYREEDLDRSIRYLKSIEERHMLNA